MSLIDMTSAAPLARAERTSTQAKAGSKGLLASVTLVYAALTGIHIIAVVEGPRWTSPLLLGDHLFDLLLAATVLWVALALGRKLAWPLLGLSDDPLTERLAACGLGLGLLSFGVLCLGMFHLYYGFVFLVAMIALALWLRDELLAALEGARGTVTRWIRTGAPTASTLGQRLMLLLLIAELAVVSVQATLPAGWSSPIEEDTLAYHLAAPKIYMEMHRIVPLPDIPLANAPAGEEILYLFGLYAKSDSIAKMLHLLFTVLLALATFSLGKRLAEPIVAWLGVFLLFDVVWLGIEAPSSGPDFASFFLIILGFADGLVWIDRLRRGGYGGVRVRQVGRQVRHRWRGLPADDLLLIRAGIFTGLGVSYKLTSIPAIPALLAVVGLATLAVHAKRPLPAIIWAIRYTLIFGLATLPALGPWLLKNGYFFGKPLYPFGIASSDPGVSTAIAVTKSTYTYLGHIEWVWANVAHIFSESVSPLSVLLFAGPFVLRRRSELAALTLLVIGVLLWINYIPVYKYPRYYVPIIALGSVLTMWVLHSILRRLPVRYALIELPLIGYLLVAGFLTFAVDITQATKDHSVDVALGKVSRDSYLAAHVRPYRAEEWINSHTPDNTTVALLGVTHGYYLDRPYLAEWYGARLYRLEGKSPQRAAELATWCKVGVRYAVLDRDPSELDGEPHPLNIPRSSFTWLKIPGLHAELRFSASAVDVFSVTPCAATQ